MTRSRSKENKKLRKDVLDKQYELLDQQIFALLRQITETVNEVDGPQDFIEWQASFYRWLAMVQSRIADLSLEHLEGHVLDDHVSKEDGTYWHEHEELKDAQKLQKHISK